MKKRLHNIFFLSSQKIKKMPGSKMIDLGEFNKFTNRLPIQQQVKALELYSNLFDSDGRIKDKLREYDIKGLIYNLVEFVKYCMYKKSWTQCENVLLMVLKEVYTKYYKGKNPFGVVSHSYRHVRKVRKSLTAINYKSKCRFDYFIAAVDFLNGGDKIYRKRFRDYPSNMNKEHFNKIMARLGKENEKITDAYFMRIEDEAYNSEDSEDEDEDNSDTDSKPDDDDDNEEDRLEETQRKKQRV